MGWTQTPLLVHSHNPKKIYPKGVSWLESSKQKNTCSNFFNVGNWGLPFVVCTFWWMLDMASNGAIMNGLVSWAQLGLWSRWGVCFGDRWCHGDFLWLKHVLLCGIYIYINICKGRELFFLKVWFSYVFIICYCASKDFLSKFTGSSTFTKNSEMRTEFVKNNMCLCFFFVVCTQLPYWCFWVCNTWNIICVLLIMF